MPSGEYERRDWTPAYERVMAKVRVEGECLVFTGARNTQRGGYGSIGESKAESGKKRPRRAHIVVWEHHNGPISPGEYVCHTCDNPPCVNIDHLWLGNVQSNTADMIAKGRMRNRGDMTKCRSGEHAWIPENWTGGKVRRCKPCQRKHDTNRRKA